MFLIVQFFQDAFANPVVEFKHSNLINPSKYIQIVIRGFAHYVHFTMIFEHLV